jgi:glucose/arabinose dehydrogenase
MPMKSRMCVLLLMVAGASRALAEEPDGLVLPPHFHASVVATGLKGLRHMVVRPDGDIYASTRGGGATGIIAIHLDQDHKMVSSQSFGTITGGTGIRLHGGYLYASSSKALFRYPVSPHALVPTSEPEAVVDGFPSNGFLNRIVAFDDRGGFFVGVGGMGNICADLKEGAPPVGQRPCPDIATRAGVWRFSADRTAQHFPADGERYVTGLRDLDAMDWRSGDALYGAMQNRNGTNETWPTLVSAADEEAIGDDMYRFAKNSDLGWPYTYFDNARGRRLQAPEYGEGVKEAPDKKYATPVLRLPAHAAPLDLLFYQGRQFPARYRGGAFLALHGAVGPDAPEGRNGYSVMFAPFARNGRAGKPTVFADGFAGPTPANRNVARAAYRPVGLAEGPDGSLYIADSVKGRIWRITYDGSK